ncbi:MAG TPA: hypothetical protein VFH97_03910, partial [Gemmatimonadales bacterium]|nr:hypothetical protein [Gemmatimonadales bacterium]
LACRARAQDGAPLSVTRAGTFGRGPITESSGVAVSRRHAGILWTHNDSNDGPNLYAVTPRGELLATVRVVGARAVDWEDIALGPCPTRWKGRTCLYIADTGDNREQRPRIVLYAVPEPDPRRESSAPLESEPALSLRVRFADRAHDVEALALDSTGTAYLVTKGRSGPILRYAVPADAWSADSIVARTRDTLPIRPRAILGRWVTGAAISPSGTQAAVRTFTEVYLFRVAPDGRWVLRGAPCRVAGLEPQGEAVDFLDEERLVLTSEKGLSAEAPIHIVRCP